MLHNSIDNILFFLYENVYTKAEIGIKLRRTGSETGIYFKVDIGTWDFNYLKILNKGTWNLIEPDIIISNLVNKYI